MKLGHIAIASVLTYETTGSVLLSCLASIVTMIPDIDVIIKTNTYELFHFPHRRLCGLKLWLFWIGAVVIYPIGLHIVLDYLVKLNNRRYYWFAEIFFNSLFIIYILGLVC